MKEFLEGVTGWNSYKPFLFKALENTKGNVLELGMGEGSTQLLHDYCLNKDRMLVSIDNTKEWADKFKHLDCHHHMTIHSDNWDETFKGIMTYKWGVVLVDHAPGEHRHKAIELLKDNTDIIVVHDSQPEATGYMLDKIFHLFKYKVDYKEFGDWATMLSNTIDITKI